MLRSIPFVGALLLPGMLTGGCALRHIDDPNYNEKIRFLMAFDHAEKVLRDTGSTLDSHDDYDLMIFFRRHYDEETEVHHRFELYDFLKTTQQSGPDRFVIAYDDITRKTYLRVDLRSNENIESLLREMTSRPAERQ